MADFQPTTYQHLQTFPEQYGLSVPSHACWWRVSTKSWLLVKEQIDEGCLSPLISDRLVSLRVGVSAVLQKSLRCQPIWSAFDSTPELLPDTSTLINSMSGNVFFLISFLFEKVPQTICGNKFIGTLKINFKKINQINSN